MKKKLVITPNSNGHLGISMINFGGKIAMKHTWSIFSTVQSQGPYELKLIPYFMPIFIDLLVGAFDKI